MLNAAATGRLLVVGDTFFLERHRPLIEALREHFSVVDELRVVDPDRLAPIRFALGALLRGELRPPIRPALRRIRERFEKRPATFVRKSRATARRISALRPRPDVVLHVFGMSAPFDSSEKATVPYAFLADATMALAARTWPAWAPYDGTETGKRWIALEGTAYRQALATFAFSAAARDSFVADYGVEPGRAIVVGAAGNYTTVGPAERSYGSRRAIFNGSDFLRKGGDLALEAIRLARERLPDATLVVVGNDPLDDRPGVEAHGHVDHATVISLMDGADVVVAPARADPMPGFVLEAMSRGCVPIVTAETGVADAVADGRSGFVVSPQAANIADRLVRTLADSELAEKLGATARATIASQWTWEAVATRIAERLREALPHDTRSSSE